MAFVPINGPVVGATVYDENGNLVARDVSFTLPEVTPTTTDLSAMGTFSAPNWQLLENMETTVTKIGLDSGLSSLIRPNMKPLEFRWVQTQTDANGAIRNVGCKAFIRGIPNKIPGIGVTVGEAIEAEITLATSRYILYVDGEEVIYIDRFAAGKLKIYGVDFSAPINSML